MPSEFEVFKAMSNYKEALRTIRTWKTFLRNPKPFLKDDDFRGRSW